MSNEDVLRNLIPDFRDGPWQPIDHSPEYQKALMIAIGFTLLWVFLIILNCIILDDIERTVGCSFFSVLAVICITIGAVNGYKLSKEKQEYHNRFEKWEVEIYEWSRQEQAYSKEVTKKVQKQMEYSVYLDGEEVEINKVHFADYSIYVDDTTESIYLSRKG